ncbi:MAG: YcaO-related McrA-glycine thioamidation protein [Methanobacteriaceae archaeon]|nr:YcaO-related McrA-glycine thioamidation protein [Methanobacteriaceae archaeon]
MFSEVPVKYYKGTHRAINPSQTISKVENKLKKAGVTRVTEITHLDRIGIPVYSAIRPSAQDGAVSIYAGKGATKNQAKASAMMEAFERYSAEKQSIDQDKIIKGTFNEMENALKPSSLILPRRLQKNPEETRLEWIESINIKTEEKILIPANAVYHPYQTDEESHIFKSNTNGLASGNIIEEAVFHGMTEVIERDAWSLFETYKKRVEINASQSDNSIITDILKRFHDVGIDIKLIDLTADISVHTVAAVADDTVLKDPALLTMGVGTHLDPEIAVIRALTEVAQSRATQIHGTREDTVRATFMRKAGYERMKRINSHWFGETEQSINIKSMKNRCSSSFKKDIEITIKQLQKCGIEDVLFVDLTRKEVGIPVARIIIPGLEVMAIDPDRIGDRVCKII